MYGLDGVSPDRADLEPQNGNLFGDRILRMPSAWVDVILGKAVCPYGKRKVSDRVDIHREGFVETKAGLE